MRLKRITAPAEAPVALAEAKAHLNVTEAHDDVLISGLIATATAHLDGEHGLLGRCLVTQTWEVVLDRFPRGAIVLPLPPTQSVESVTYLDAANASRTLSIGALRIGGLGTSEPVDIWPALNTSWPVTLTGPNAVTVRFVAGYGAPAAVPDPLKRAILGHVATLYANRESLSGLQSSMRDVGPAYEDLISPFIAWDFFR